MDKVANNEKISEAVKLINNRSYEEALECLKDIINENKNDPKIFNLYGIVKLQLNNMDDDEESMLDQAFDVKNNSRLSCQINLSEELDGLKIEIAPE